MGDTPSLAYVMNGVPNNPEGESWGGSFMPIKHSSRSIFNRKTTIKDTVSTYGVIEWNFKGPVLDIPIASKTFTMEISNQTWQGYYMGDGTYSIRYASKKQEICTYITTSEIPELKVLQRHFARENTSPGTQNPKDYLLGTN